MMHNARAPEKTLLHLPEVVPSQRTGGTPSTGLQ